jgi:hypothetical protein
MINELLADHFKNNHRVFQLNTSGISHAESLLTIREKTNSMNWITGHIAVTRDRILELLGQEKIFPQEMIEKYKRGSAVLIPADALPFEKLVSLFNNSQERLLNELSNYDFSKPEMALKINFFAFHEAYHCGQIGLLRRLAGKEGQIK